MKFTDEQIKYMVDRFLTWELPQDFHPDGGIIFHGTHVDALGYKAQWPIGTNLFTASQAEEMVRHILGEKR